MPYKAFIVLALFMLSEVVQVGTMPVDSVSAMVTALRYHEPGAVVTIGVVRDDQQLSFSVVLGSLDDNNE